MALLYASDRILGFPELRKAALQYFEDWALHFDGGLTVVQANLTELTVDLVQVEITRRKVEAREASVPVPPYSVLPPQVPTEAEEQAEPTGSAAAEAEAEAEGPISSPLSFDSTNSKLYFDSEVKQPSLPQSEEEEGGESESPPVPLPLPNKLVKDSAAAEVRKQLLSLFLRAPKLKYIAPNKLKQVQLSFLAFYFVLSDKLLEIMAIRCSKTASTSTTISTRTAGIALRD